MNATSQLADCIRRAVAALGGPETDIAFDRPREEAHGDLATNVAMRLAKPLGRPPREIADEILRRLTVPDGMIRKAEVAGPGFINFWLADSWLVRTLARILEEGERYGRDERGAGRRVNVEFVSANPTGPLHVGHGRGAALGDAIASLLEATGHDVTREFYINDAGVQIDRLGLSLWARIQQRAGRDAEIPEGGYHGEYLEDLAARIVDEEGLGFANLDPEEGVPRCRDVAVREMRAEQRRDLEEFGVTFDTYTSERTVYEQGHVDAVLEELEARGHLFERDGALWFRTSPFGDAKDRVLRKSNGTYTYFLPDIAYHRTKAERGFHQAIDVWGADHGGYIDRMRSAMMALGLAEDFFRAVIVQLVRIVRHGVEVKFSKRSGEFVTLRDLFAQTGVDAARYFFLMRKAESQFVFDVDLAMKQSDDNPVYYVQYAHTRMAGIFRTGELAPESVRADGADLSALAEKDELDLINHLGEFPRVVDGAATHLEPHRIIGYLEETARLVNGWYHRHRVLGEAEAVTRARLVLARASQIVLGNGLRLLGITAPERM